MRNWNFSYLWKGFRIFWVASLPMRNWNMSRLWFWFADLPVASLPMRNWNKNRLLSLRMFLSVASLPMRNWNFQIAGYSKYGNKVASLPMRNWNALILKKFLSGGASCEPTNEELKRAPEGKYFVSDISVASLPMRNWNELLKENILLAIFRCEPTYEELKLRLWKTRGSVRERLRAYLWGIETGLNESIFLKINSLRAYLWGIETRNHANINRDNLGCEPTYEELKRWNQFFALAIIPSVASLPMRNWNSSSCPPYEIETFSLRAYLWGIETKHKVWAWA